MVVIWPGQGGWYQEDVRKTLQGVAQELAGKDTSEQKETVD